MAKGKLVIYTGCSGVGKGTIMRELLSKDETVKLSVSCTTRQPRPGEVHGTDYFFIDKTEFENMISQGEFLEHAVYCDNYYGTPGKAVDEMLEKGLNVFLEIEVQGGMQVMKIRPDALTIFVMPPSMEELERRLRNRGTEDEETIQKRLACAKEEMTYAKYYQNEVVNDTVERATQEILDIIHKDN